MAGDRRKKAAEVIEVGGEEKTSEKEETRDGTVMVLDDPSSELEVAKLRGRWELASVLNFLNVFEPVIGSQLKLGAEDIEAGLITPNRLLTQLHITLLKGIPPVSKALNDSDAWVIVLRKKLAMWWPWVAAGEIPLTATNGEEMTQYKVLDPIDRLLILKGLCELRVEQDDAVSFINDALKQGTQVSSFRKVKIGGYGNGISYWYDGNEVIGYRLYREVHKTDSKPKMKGKAQTSTPDLCHQWETLATNLEEFREVVHEMASSEVVAEVAIGKIIEGYAIPLVEKLHKKKERALKRKQQQEKRLNGFKNSFSAGITRSCRNRRPANYTFDEYDRSIDEAIQVIKKSKTVDEQRREKRCTEQRKIASNGGSDTGRDSNDSCSYRDDSTDSDTASRRLEEALNDGDEDDNDYDVKRDSIDGNGSYLGDSEEENDNVGSKNHWKHLAPRLVGSRCSERFAGSTGHTVLEPRNLGTKSWLRQRPTRNSALEESVVPDSDDENL